MSTSQGRKKVIVAMSGGVDSSVAALLLKERGFDVRGVHIKMWSPNQSLRDGTGQTDPFTLVCKQQYQDRIDAMRVAAKLSIPFETWDFTKEYKQGVVDYMIREYAEGRTPNPDVMCNSRIKFGVFLQRALEMGADYVATGHYVRLMRKSQITNHKSQTNSKLQTTNYKLLTARDANKDQSYFLWTLTQEQLKHCLFPIGDYTKPEVRTLARKYALPTADKKDSQGLCFIGKIDIREFLKNHIPEKRGRVLTTSGKRVGEHAGLEFYTLGQRRGIGIGGGTPYYVAEKDPTANTLVVAEGQNDLALFQKELVAENWHWISGETLRFPLHCEARIRYRQPLQSCRVTQINRGQNADLRRFVNPRLSASESASIRVLFRVGQRAVTPGQSIVFYKNGEMLGGGVILQ